MRHKRGYYDVFIAACAKFPSNVAVTDYVYGEYKSYTYSELFGVCEYIAQNIRQLQCSKGLIGLVSHRNIIIPCVIAAVHKYCTTFMFVDPSRELETVASDLNFQVLINIRKESEDLLLGNLARKPDKTVSVFGYSISFYNYDKQNHIFTCMQGHSFVTTTSGSTGTPKHIQVPIQCIQPNIDDLTKLFNITPEDVIYFSTPLTFDPSMVEILLACTNGASLLIAPAIPDILFPEDKHHSVTVWQTTPSNFFQQSNVDIKSKILSENSTLKVLALGGEPLNGVKRLQNLKDSNNETRIFTLYGVSEMSCWACVTELDLTKCNVDREIPLGNCLSETEIVMEPHASNNKTGKIVLVSKTRNCIIINKGQDKSSLKFVDTGDIGEIKNGTIYYRGRKDDVIKRFGHKINLQLIEYAVMQCPRIKTCSCVWLPKPMLLVVYFSSETLSSQELSDFLKCKLDDKHWPDKIIKVNNLPITAHGKISKLILSTLHEHASEASHTIDSIKVMLLQAIKEVLNHKFTYDDIKDKQFFALGGTSFLAVSMCNKISVHLPHFGKFLLPHLMAQRHTIEEIMQLPEMKSCTDVAKPKKRLKRTASNTDNISQSLSSKKIITNEKNEAVEFVFLWSHDTGKCVDATPTLFESNLHLYVAVGSHSGRIMVFDALTGISQGTIKLHSRIEAAVFCYHEQPHMEACGVVGAYDGTVVCFTLVECKEKWRVNVGFMVKSKATLCNGFVYVAAYNGHVFVIDAMAGVIVNSIFVSDQAISADLVLAKNKYILVGTLSGVCASIQTEINSVVWRGTLESPIFANPAIYNEDKYVVFAEVNGEIHCRTVEKGITIWKFCGAKGNIFSSIHIKELGTLNWQMVFGCHDKKVYSISVKNFQPSLKWTAELSAPVYSTPCALNAKLLLAASKDGIIYVIDSNQGMILAEYKLPSETFSSPTVFFDYVFIGCRNDHIVALQCVLY